MLARTFRAQLTRSRTGIVQPCFQHNINFPVTKSPTWRPPVLTALSAPCDGPLRPPEAPWCEGPCGLRSPGLSDTPPLQDNTLDSYLQPPLQSVRCFYSPQHRNVWLQDGSKRQACVCVCVRESTREKIPFPRGVCTSNIKTHVHFCRFGYDYLHLPTHWCNMKNLNDDT